MFNLKDKTAIVAGGSGLIGKAIVKGLREQNADVLNIDSKIGLDLSSLTIKKIRDLSPDIFINVTYPKNFLTHQRLYTKFTKRIAEVMSKKGGSIINFASIYGMIGSDYRIYEGTDMDCEIEYCAVKGAIISLSRALATKYAKYGVRINWIVLGGVQDNQPKSFIEKYCDRVPMQRMAMPSDVVGAIVFLASNDSSYITGTGITIDGGLTAW